MTIEEFAKAYVGYMIRFRGGRGAVTRAVINDNNTVTFTVWKDSRSHGTKDVEKKFDKKYENMTVQRMRKYMTDAIHLGYFCNRTA
jgi:hypothetical protein